MHLEEQDVNKTIIRTALASLALAAAGLAYVSMHPVQRTSLPLTAAQAHALLASIGAGTQGPAAAGSIQRMPRTVVTDVDNVRGLRFEVKETADRYVAILTPFSPDPQHAAHMNAPTLPAHALVRHDSALVVTDYPMTQVGSSWIVAVPKGGLTLLPGDRIYAGVWGPGASYPEPDEADYWQWWSL